MKFISILLTFSCLLILEANGQELLTLDSCRQQAIKNNAKIKIANNQLLSSQENVEAIRRDLYPVITGDANYKFLAEPMSIELDGTRFTGTELIYNVGATVRQNVYSGGRVRLTSENAKLQEHMAGSNLTLTTDQLLFATELAYWKSIWSKEAFNISNQYKALLDTLVKVINDKVETGLISKNDLLMAEVRQNEAELLIYKSRTMHEVSLMELNRIIGNEINKSIVVESSIIYNDYSLPVPPALNQVLLERPEVSIKKDMVGMELNKMGLTKSKYTPEFYINLSPIWGAPNTNLMDSDPIFNVAAYASVTMPLVQWGKRSHEVGTQSYKYQASVFELEDLHDQINLEVTSAYYQLKESIDRITLTEASLDKAKENYDLIEDRYLEGLSPIIELLNAQYSWLLAYNAVLDARLNYLIVLSEYKRVVGQI